MAKDIFSEDTRRTIGRDAQRLNIAAARLVAQTVRTTLGPRGMDKMLVNAAGDITVTNDGVTILREMEISHPSAKMIVEIAKTQEEEVGDGTTTAVVLAGELLKNAETLLDKEIHPTIIIKGYRLAAIKAQEILKSLAKPISKEDTQLLQKIAHTAMTGKGSEDAKEELAKIVVEAILAVQDKESIRIETQSGGSIHNTELIQGIVLNKERTHAGMPKQVKEAKIALINTGLEIKNTEIEAKINISDPDKLQGFLDMEERMLKKLVMHIKESGATAVFCQRGIDELAQHYLAKEGIFAVRRVTKTDLESLSKATGAKIINNVSELATTDLGLAGIVEEKKEKVYVKECASAKAVTIVVHGGSEHIILEIKRALEDAIGDLSSALEDGRIIAGAAASEMAVSKKLSQFATTLQGREQLAVQAFADAMEIIPITLAENAGIDPIDALAMLKAHEGGIDVFTGEHMDPWKEGVIEPLRTKTQALSSASEVAIMILRIDDVIATQQEKS